MRTNIIIGSRNPTKVHAVQTVFPDHNIISISARSKVSAQPIGNEETRKGAIYRAKDALKNEDAPMSIGLEGGVLFLQGELYLCNWGALQTASGKIYTASGGLIPLPSSFIEPLRKGEELATLMNCWTNRTSIRSTEGAVGIFTNGLITREQLYVYICTLLKGQYTYDRGN